MFSDVEVRRCDGGDHDSSPPCEVMQGQCQSAELGPLSQQSPFTGPQLSALRRSTNAWVSISQNTSMRRPDSSGIADTSSPSRRPKGTPPRRPFANRAPRTEGRMRRRQRSNRDRLELNRSTARRSIIARRIGRTSASCSSRSRTASISAKGENTRSGDAQETSFLFNVVGDRHGPLRRVLGGALGAVAIYLRDQITRVNRLLHDIERPLHGR